MSKGKSKVELIRDPWLIQRCSVKAPFDSNLKTGDYLKLDYMGSAEFEFGAIPKFQREIHPKLDRLHIFEYTHHDGVKLYFWCELEQKDAYTAVVQKLMSKSIRLKESMHLDFKETLYVGKNRKPMYDQPHAPFTTTVWFDLTNNLVIARDRQVLHNLLTTIPNSVRFMDQQKGA